ncbi:hypothetical protein CGX12_06400 [Zobellella denitrificans]|nr:hypothetical protein CGX12_06400 [Zobellella denitrificans]
MGAVPVAQLATAMAARPGGQVLGETTMIRGKRRRKPAAAAPFGSRMQAGKQGDGFRGGRKSMMCLEGRE